MVRKCFGRRRSRSGGGYECFQGCGLLRDLIGKLHGYGLGKSDGPGSQKLCFTL